MKKNIIFILSFLISIPIFSQQPGAGLNFDDEKFEKVIKKAPLTRSLYSSLPKKHSMRKYAPIIKSQGSYGTCVGWSSAYAAFTICNAMKNNTTDKDLITKNAFSPGFIYKQIKQSSDQNCTYGSHISDALDIMKTKGVAKYSDMSEVNCPTYISPQVFSKATKYKVKDYAKLFGLYDNKAYKISSVKKSLSQDNPIIIGMMVPNSFYKAEKLWSPTESELYSYPGHAMCVIGYDDDLFGGSFEIMNSWGTSWGENGYTWIKYDDFSKFVKYAFEITDIMSSGIKQNTKLEGSVRFVLSDGIETKATLKNNAYKMNQAYKSGTMFRLYISNNQPSYVYAFGSDATEKIFPIFPHNEKISPALNYKQNDVAIPDEEHYIKTDNTVGTDYLCVLYSKKPLSIKSIHQKIENSSGTFFQKIKNAVGADKLAFGSNLHFSSENISFKFNSSQKTVVALIVETDHTK